MAATDVFMISSSPPRQFKNYSLMSSSPPSLEELVKKRPQALRSGSQAAPIPQNATASFTSAATFWKSTSSRATTESAFAITLDTPKEQSLDLPPKEKSVKSKITKKDAQDKLEDGEVAKKRKKNTTNFVEKKDEDEPKKKARKPRLKQSDDSAENAENRPAKAPRKRAKKAVDDASKMKENPAGKSKKELENDPQTKLSKGKVTKVSSKLTAKSNDTIETNQGLSQIKSTISDDPFAESIDFGLDEAVKRRSNWTPPKTKFVVETSVSIEGSASPPGSTESGEKNGFSDLLKNYGLTKAAAPIRIAKALEGAGTRKRKLIELVSANPSTASISPPKAKVTAAKKARTITDLATSAYIEEVEDSARQGQLLQYLSLPPLVKSTSDEFKVPAKPKSRSKTPVKRGQPKKYEYILLSPQSALKEVGDQDFVFGTSSQLAREESPTLLRDLQEAMQASNEIDDPFAELNDFQPPPRQRKNISWPKSLWGAAARDDDSNATNDKTRHDINKSNEAQAAIFDQIRQNEKAIKSDLDRYSDRIPTKDTSLQQKPIDKISKRPSKPAKSAGLEMPNFESYTTAQLAKEVASYRFKPIKNRAQMIVLLEKCWEGKHRPALGILGTNKIIENSESLQQKEKSPKWPRGRPKNDATANSSPKRSPKSKKPPQQKNFEDMETNGDPRSSPIRTPIGRKKLAKPVEDISDSEAEHTPSPRRSSGSSSKFASLPLKPSIDADVDNIVSSQELVFSHITRAIKAAPRSTDSVNPSWHEKILLYDPIIIEDLTAWLNTGALQMVGWDDEVEPKEVKKWCESKSICCLWKENLRGGARGRY